MPSAQRSSHRISDIIPRCSASIAEPHPLIVLACRAGLPEAFEKDPGESLKTDADRCVVGHRGMNSNGPFNIRRAMALSTKRSVSGGTRDDSSLRRLVTAAKSIQRIAMDTNARNPSGSPSGSASTICITLRCSFSDLSIHNSCTDPSQTQPNAAPSRVRSDCRADAGWRGRINGTTTP